MKTKLKKSPLLYALAALLLAVPVIGIGYLFVDAVSEIMEKRRLMHGVQIMATVTDHESHFNVVRGGGFNTYEIDYEFQYTDRQTGQLKTHVRTDYEVYQKEYVAFTPGSTFVASFIPREPTVNEPATTVGRLSPQTVLLTKLITGSVFVSVVSVLVWRFSHLFVQLRGSKKTAVIAGVFSVALITGLMAGESLARLLERLLLS